MIPKRTENYVVGVDFGTDSCRALLVDAASGDVAAVSVASYPRWKQGLYCDPISDRYRQHPLDYVESFESAMRDLLDRVGADEFRKVRAISFDTTGSTPVLTDRAGVPLALCPGFADDPDAMFVLWKDHTAKDEAEQINALAHRWDVDFTAYSGGTYSAEWAWAKVLHVLRSNPRVRSAAYAWIEHSDWMGALLTGQTCPEKVLRNRCAAGHKAMWHESWNGLPSESFLAALDPLLKGWRDRFRGETVTADRPVGVISPEYAGRLGLAEGTVVGVGMIDAHAGAVGACIQPHVLTRIMGTSTCDILVCPPDELSPAPVRGICGQVNGSVVPGLVGFEAGQSAFGDLYAWFRDLLLWPVGELCPGELGAIGDRVIECLSRAAEAVPVEDASVLALDWMNGRRTPDADQHLRGAICNLTMGSSAPMIFRSLVEATAFGSKAIVDRFVEEGIRVDAIIAIGGISQKSPFVMQVLSDVLNMPIDVSRTDQACALGAAMFAAVAAGLYPDIHAAQCAMGSGVGKRYEPNPRNHRLYMERYEKYLKLGKWIESAKL